MCGAGEVGGVSRVNVLSGSKGGGSGGRVWGSEMDRGEEWDLALAFRVDFPHLS